MGLNQGIKSTQKSQTIFVNWLYALDLNTHFTPRSWAFGWISTTSQQPIWPTYQIPSSLQSSVVRDLVCWTLFFQSVDSVKSASESISSLNRSTSPRAHAVANASSIDRHSVRAQIDTLWEHMPLHLKPTNFWDQFQCILKRNLFNEPFWNFNV